MRYCPKCEKEILDDCKYCPECGGQIQNQSDGLKSDTDSRIDSPSNPQNKRINRKVLIYAGIGVLIAIAALLFVIFQAPKVERITLTKSTISLSKGDTFSAPYIIAPVEAKDAKTSWASSDDSVASVDSNGKIVANGVGECTISVQAGKETDTMTVLVDSIVGKWSWTEGTLTIMFEFTGNGKFYSSAILFGSTEVPGGEGTYSVKNGSVSIKMSGEDPSKDPSENKFTIQNGKLQLYGRTWSRVK